MTKRLQGNDFQGNSLMEHIFYLVNFSKRFILALVEIRVHVPDNFNLAMEALNGLKDLEGTGHVPEKRYIETSRGEVIDVNAAARKEDLLAKLWEAVPYNAIRAEISGERDFSEVAGSALELRLKSGKDVLVSIAGLELLVTIESNLELLRKEFLCALGINPRAKEDVFMDRDCGSHRNFARLACLAARLLDRTVYYTCKGISTEVTPYSAVEELESRYDQRERARSRFTNREVPTP